MAGQGGNLVALDVQPFDLAAPYQAANQITAGQQTNTLNAQLNPLKVQQVQSELAGQTTRNASADLALAQQKQHSELATQDYQNALIANAASLIDPSSPDAPEQWDAAMKTAAAKGAEGATQFVGRFSPALLQRVTGAYSAKSPLEAQAQLTGGGMVAPAPMTTAVGGAAPAQIDPSVKQQIDQMPAPQLAQTTDHLTKVADALKRVQSSANPSWEWLQEAQQLGLGEIAGPYDPHKVQQLWGEIQPTLAYVQQRQTMQQAGVPAPVAPTQIEQSGGGLFAISPTAPGGPTVKTLVPRPANYQDASGAFDAQGNPILYDRTTGQLAPGVSGGSASPLTTFADRMAGLENGTGNPSAKNPASSAVGDGQFLKGTWVNLIKSERPDLAQGKTDAQILALRSDPDLSRQMIANYATENATKLQAAGDPVTYTTLALAHRFGPDGAQAIIAAPQNAPLEKILSPAVLAANPNLKGQTAGTYVANLAAQVGNTAPISPADQANLSGDDFLKTLPPARAAMIKAMANGDLAIPTGRAATSGVGLKLMQDIEQYDPSASASNLPSRSATRKSFTSGPYSQTINAANTVIGHLGNLSGAIDALQNTGLSWWNGPMQAVQQAAGNETTQKAVADFNTYKTMVANELTKVYRGSNGAEADIQGWQNQLNAAQSPVALHAVVNAMVNGLDSRLDALGTTYSQGMGRAEDPVKLLNPHAAQVLTQLRARASGAAPQAAGAPAPPAVGTVVKGYRFGGGNPASPASWIRVSAQ